MEVFVDPSYREALDRAKETAARRREDAAKKMGSKSAAEAWLAKKNESRRQYLGR